MLLGSIIPPVGGVIMADYWYRHRGQYPSLAAARLPRFNRPAYRACHRRRTRLYLAGIAPIVGIAASAAACHIVLQIARAFTREPSVQGE